MDTPAAGDLVRYNGGGPALDAIVFDIPSRTKVVIAVVDPARGPCFRSVHPDSLSARDGEGPADAPLRGLIRRTQPPAPGPANGRGGVRKAAAGFSRGASHRSTGR